tara:strand:+ start:647 stop:1282 length:636 start_codon:yes stop_codon:yes gene_type:complete
VLVTEISEAQVGISVFPTSETSYKNSLTGIPESLFNPYQDYEFHETHETALSLHAAGNHVQALKLLRKALISNRIQEGFYNETQVALQKAMIEIEKGQGNWKTVDDLYSHLELIYRRLYDRNPQKLEDGLREISAWLAYSLNTIQIGGRHQKLHRAYRILKQRLEIYEKQLGVDSGVYNFKVSLLSEKISILERQLYPTASKENSDRYRNW